MTTETQLHQLGSKYGTDKIYRSATHAFSTLDIYDSLFDKYFNRNDTLNILEIGVRQGSSIHAMLDYFPNSTIYGLDICDCPESLKNNSRFHFIKGDQTKEEDLQQIIHKASEFDIIIDDGCHLIEAFIFSFSHLFAYLNTKGLYIIEDLYNCYKFWNTTKTTAPNGDGELFNQFISDLNHKIHRSRQSPDSSPIFSIHTYPGLLAVRKSL